MESPKAGDIFVSLLGNVYLKEKYTYRDIGTRTTKFCFNIRNHGCITNVYGANKLDYNERLIFINNVFRNLEERMMELVDLTKSFYIPSIRLDHTNISFARMYVSDILLYFALIKFHYQFFHESSET